jgi:hypothetical protein
MNTDDYEGFDLADYEKYSGGEVTGPLIAEVKRLQAYKEFADGIFEWSHGAAHIHFLATIILGIRRTGELDEDALNHGCSSYYNGPNSSSQASMGEYKELRAFVLDTALDNKRLRSMFEESNHHLDLMVERFGIEALVEMVGDEEE